MLKLDNNVWDAIVLLMDSDIREQVHNRLAPCTEYEFLEAYMKEDPEFVKMIRQEFSGIFPW